MTGKRDEQRDQGLFLEQLFGLDRLLVSKGWPGISGYWKRAIVDFYESGVRTMVVSKGRRVGASTIVGPRLAVTEALHGGHERHLSPGDRAIYAFVSVRRDEAKKRLVNLRALLDVIGVPYRVAQDTIELQTKPIDFSLLTASFRTSVGDTAVGVWCDELSRWTDSDTGANPAREVLASIRPTVATLPDARIWLVSSPLGKSDAHYDAVQQGNNSLQRVYCGPTWLWNPTLTEAQTRSLEPDRRVWEREYAAIPQEAKSAAFDRDAVLACFRKLDPAYTPSAPIGVVDWSSGRSDAATLGIVSWQHAPQPSPYKTVQRYRGLDPRTDEPRWWPPEIVRDKDGNPLPNPDFKPAPPPTLAFTHIEGFESSFWQQLPASTIIHRWSATLKAAGVRHVVGDQREAFLLQSEFGRHGLGFHSIAWSQPNKQAAVERLRRWMREGQLTFAGKGDAWDKLMKELLSFEEKVTATGMLTYAGRGNTHDDYAALVLTTAMADAEGMLPDNPWRPRRRFLHRNIPQL